MKYTLEIEYMGPFPVQSLYRSLLRLPPLQEFKIHRQLFNPRGTSLWDFGVSSIYIGKEKVPEAAAELEKIIRDRFVDWINNAHGIRFLSSQPHHGPQLIGGLAMMTHIPAYNIEVVVNRYSE